MRTLIIGDIHGRVESLKGVLSQASYNPKEDRLICIGDYVDYGPASYEVVEFLIDVQEQSPYENIYLMGNHDKLFYEVLQDNFVNLSNREYIMSRYWTWYVQGGRETYVSYTTHSDQDVLRHKKMFSNKLQLFHIKNNILYVHAGYDEKLGLKATIEQLANEEVIWNRSLYQAAYNYWRSEQRGADVSHQDQIFDGFDRIYIGHTPTTKDGIKEPVLMGKLVNLDQGCKMDGRLTAWVGETGEWFQYE